MIDVCVFGSINMDSVFRVALAPAAGQTVIAETYVRGAGGKGANQAVAAARAGAKVAMAGCVGADEDGKTLLALLKNEGIDCVAISETADLPTGTAFVIVEELGENRIVVGSAANIHAQTPRELTARVYLAQLEVSVAEVDKFISARPANSLGILNAAPYFAKARHLLGKADMLVLNETELAGYSNGRMPNSRAEAIAFAKSLLVEGQTIIVTLGAEGAVAVSEHDVWATQANPTLVRDTIGAGDCFCGYLAANLAQGAELRKALASAHQAAGISVGRDGAISSIPYAYEIGRTQ